MAGPTLVAAELLDKHTVERIPATAVRLGSFGRILKVLLAELGCKRHPRCRTLFHRDCETVGHPPCCRPLPGTRDPGPETRDRTDKSMAGRRNAVVEWVWSCGCTASRRRTRRAA